jgi:hypothetical protein
MSSTATVWMRDYVWPEIQTMMLNDAHFRLVLAARQLTGKLKGPTGKLIDDGYVTFQMVTIRRLCDNDEDVFSLRAVLKKAREEKPNLTEQINQLSGSLGACAHVCDQVNKHVAHTANPETCRDWKQWDIDLQDLEQAHKSICQVAFKIDRYILPCGLPSSEVMPVLQHYFAEDLMLWVSEEQQDKLNKSWHDNRKRVNSWILKL